MGFTGNMKYKNEDDFIAHANKLEIDRYAKDAKDNDGFFYPKANRWVHISTIETDVEDSGWGQNQNGQR